VKSMKYSIWLLLIALFTLTSCNEKSSERTQFAKLNEAELTISKSELQERIKGAWAAQVIGVTFGLPAKFKYNSSYISDYQPLEWNATMLKNEYDIRPGTYDDIYMDLSFMEVIEKEEIDAPAQSFANSFAGKDYRLWFANQTARYNVRNGLTPPESGHWLNNPCADDIDFQIEADFIGLMNPGMVNSSSLLCDKIGHIMNFGDGYYGGLFVATLYSLALIADDAYDMSFNHALQMIEKGGGSSSGDEVHIKVQQPNTVPLEVAFEGHYPVKKVIPERKGREISFEFEEYAHLQYNYAMIYDNKPYDVNEDRFKKKFM